MDPMDPWVTGQRQAMILSHLDVNILIPLGCLLASTSFMLSAQECPGQGTLWAPPPHGAWVAGAEGAACPG